jgi:hypothetical protein
MILNCKKFWISILIALLVFALACWIITALESSVSPHELTTSNMVVNRIRIFNYIRDHGALPQSLNQLSVADGKGSSTEDGWGRPIFYSVDTNGVVILESFGKDGKSKDIIESFPTKDANGRWLSN